MSFSFFLCPKPRAVAIAAVSGLVLSFPAIGQTPDLVFEVGDVTACDGQQNIAIPFYISNYNDTVVAFSLDLQTDRPDILLFDIRIDTVIDTTRWQCLAWDGDNCLDSVHVTGDTTYWRCNAWVGDSCTDSTVVSPDSAWDFSHPAEWDFIHIDTNEILAGNIDTTGALISGWEWLESRSLSGYGTDLFLGGVADLPGGAATPGFGPQEGGLLLYLTADLLESPDSPADDTVTIPWQTLLTEHFCFKSPQDGWGECIGNPVMVVTLDTTFYRCTAWAGEICLNWQVVSGPPYDSMLVHWDTSFVVNIEVNYGSLTVLPVLVGDIDGSGSLPMNIADLVYLVDWMFSGGPSPICPQSADCNGDSSADIADLVCWVDWMFPRP